MNFDLGLDRLKQLLPAKALGEYAVLESRLRDNLYRERLYGSTESTRAERAEINNGLNQLALAYLNTNFNDLCKSDFEVARATIPNGLAGEDELGRLNPDLDELSRGAERGMHSLQRELTELQDSLRLIQERKAEYVISTEIPLGLIKEERRLLERIAELEQQIGT
jgi:hypothetical protein